MSSHHHHTHHHHHHHQHHHWKSKVKLKILHPKCRPSLQTQGLVSIKSICRRRLQFHGWNRSKFSLHWVTPQVSKGTTVSVARINHPLEVHWGSPHAELDMGPIPVKNGENWTWAYPSSSIFHLHRTQSNPALLTKASVTPLTLQFLGHPQTTAVLQPA
jgi:hypothetical protein